MVERDKIIYSPKNLALSFLKGQVFQGPQEGISYAKFVRIGKLVLVSPDGMGVNHESIIVEPGLGANDVPKFLYVARRLADSNSVQIDAGEIFVSLKRQTISLKEQSYALHPKRHIPTNITAREISREIVEALTLSPGFTVMAETPPSLKPKSF